MPVWNHKFIFTNLRKNSETQKGPRVNKKTKILLTASAVAALAVPAVATADFMDKYNAADQVSRVAHRRYGIDPFVSCRQIGKKVYTCSVSDFGGDCYYEGRANVKKANSYTYRVTYLSLRKTCF